MDGLFHAVSQFLEIVWLNAILSGDNAVVIGLAAAGLPAAQRNKAVLYGILFAAVLRIGFSLFATVLLDLWWIDVIGGVALLYIAWNFLSELRSGEQEDHADGHAPQEKTLMQALWQIIVADVSMSLDNVLAIAAVARDDKVMLVVGLAVSVLLMGALGGVLARILDRFRWIAYVGVALIAWIGLKLMWEGAYAADAAMGLGMGVPAPV